MKKVDGKSTFQSITHQVRTQNKEAWNANKANLKGRFRGNCWTILKRLASDFRNHYGNQEREKRQEMPYVAGDWLYTSPALIAYAEGKSMDNSTVNRWLKALQTDENKMLDGQAFILEQKLVSPTRMGLRLNMEFFEFMDLEPPNGLPPKKPPEGQSGHIELSKLAHKFNKKHHIR